MRKYRPALLLAALVAARVVILAVQIHVVQGQRGPGLYRYDPMQYHKVASAAGRAWRDFAVPFPPVGFLVMKLTNASTITGLLPRLVWSQLGAELLVAGALWYGWGRRAATVVLAFGTVFLVRPFVYFRIDLVAVAFAAWGMAMLRRHHDLPAGVLLALGVFAKVWPAALVPATLAARRLRAFIAGLVTSVVGLAAWVWWGGGGGPGQVLTLRGAHGWQVESLPGSVWQLVAGGTPRFEVGAWRIGTMPAWSRTSESLLLLTAIGLTWWFASKVPEDAWALRDGVAPLVAVTAFLVFGPIISPQYLVWLTPFAALAWVGGERRLATVAVIASALTVVLTYRYAEMLSGDAGPQLLLVGRNALLVGLVVGGLKRLHDARGRGGAAAGHAHDTAPQRELAPVG